MRNVVDTAPAAGAAGTVAGEQANQSKYPAFDAAMKQIREQEGMRPMDWAETVVKPAIIKKMAEFPQLKRELNSVGGAQKLADELIKFENLNLTASEVLQKMQG